MKNEILELRKKGNTYKQICDKLGCAKSTVSYYCGEKQKEKAVDRKRKSRKESVISKRVERFQYDRKIKDKTEDFQRDRLPNSKLGKRSLTFSWRDVVDKFGWETNCYLTGKKINLREPKTYHFDHIEPISKGGPSTIDNLGICLKEANKAKDDLSIEELLDLCKDILEHHDYEVNKTAR